MNRRLTFTFLMAAAALFTSTGCMSYATMQSATTAGAGKTELALEPSYEGATVSGTMVFAPRADLALRYGISDRVDIGARVGATVFEVLGKFMLTDPANPSIAMSLAPSLGGFSFGTGEAALGLVNLSVPLLIGIKTHGGSELVIAPKLIDQFAFAGATGAGAGGNVISLGASLGYAANFGGFKIIPEIALAYPLVGTVTASANGDSATMTDTIGGGLAFQVGVGLVFGGR